MKVYTNPDFAKGSAVHTPGPWREYNADGGRIFKNWRVAAGEQTVCIVADANDSDRANARLIAAAPEMLEALRLAAPLVEVLLEMPADEDYAAIEKTYVTIKAAIAEATETTTAESL